MIWLMQKMESALLPSPDRLLQNGTLVSLSLRQKVQHYAFGAFQLGVSLAVSPVALLYSGARSLFGRATPAPPMRALAPTVPLPAHRGFADSLFQTSGLGTRQSATPLQGTANWEKWLTPARIEGTDSNTDYRTFFTDVLGNPDAFIAQLGKMGVSAYRFSLEWSVMEPKKGERGSEALRLYTTFIKKLRDAKIEPYVTLHHFVLPQWFETQGGFNDLNNVSLFITHAQAMIAAFPSVKYWMTFNEPGVFAFQTYVRGVYPPGITGDVATAGRVMRNLMYAHCQIYQAVKSKNSDVQIGITHQWLKFEPLCGNPLEKAICYFLSKISHYAVYNFFKTGQFSLEIPFKANVQFSIPEKEFKRNNRFVDFFGVQFYAFPRLKMGFNGGEKHPGYKITNLMFWKTGLTFGSTCPKGGKAQSFGPGFYPESLQACLNEAWALDRPIAITEIGCDARIQKWGSDRFEIDNETQAEYFRKIFPIIQRQAKRLQALFVWTFWRGHLEWDRGDQPILGTVTLLKTSTSKAAEGFVVSPAGEFLAETFKAAKQPQLDHKDQRAS